jgi:hypothetical protein
MPSVTGRPVHARPPAGPNRAAILRPCAGEPARGWRVTGGTPCPHFADIPQWLRSLPGRGWRVTRRRGAALDLLGGPVPRGASPAACARTHGPQGDRVLDGDARAHCAEPVGTLANTSSASSWPRGRGETSDDRSRNGGERTAASSHCRPTRLISRAPPGPVDHEPAAPNAGLRLPVDLDPAAGWIRLRPPLKG